MDLIDLDRADALRNSRSAVNELQPTFLRASSSGSMPSRASSPLNVVLMRSCTGVSLLLSSLLAAHRSPRCRGCLAARTAERLLRKGICAGDPPMRMHDGRLCAGTHSAAAASPSLRLQWLCGAAWWPHLLGAHVLPAASRACMAVSC